MPIRTITMADRGVQLSEALLIQTWLSPTFPTGGFSYSHALETLVDDGRVTSADEVVDWLSSVLAYGGGWTDGLLCREAWRAVAQSDNDRLGELADFAAALPGTTEFELETVSQGKAFLRAVAAGWPDYLPGVLMGQGGAAMPIAVGACCAAASVSQDRTLAAYLGGLTGHLISAACRLVPLGQSDAQRATAAINAQLPDLVELLMQADFEQLGTCAWVLDLASMSHETLHTRLFRS
ncbi:MAG: urease accessory UreF family protein [Pseudomonadota bacterium]